MSDVVIHIERISKKYQIGKSKSKNDYKTIRDSITNVFVSPFRRVGKLLRGQATGAAELDETIWALRNISLEVKRGEVIGIIGKNGAGKSTLLKILSRIIEPTEGRARICGRVGSLLEVGTGFHPELTGRENIYLNGSILGMKRKEIEKNFDEIISFAEIEKFIDTPVKFYSSGMYMRLAFAVAAHLEPEILIVDEVLAVGDVAFQKKCLGKMNEVARQGRTVLFVSHNMASILALCSRAILIEDGEILCDGMPGFVVGQYQKSVNCTEPVLLEQRTDRGGDGSALITSVKIRGLDHDKIIRSTSRLKITLNYKSPHELRRPRFVISVYDSNEVGIFSLDSEAAGGLPEKLPANGTVQCITDPINLTEGSCFINLGLLRGGVQADYVNRAAKFDVESDDFFGSGKMPTRDWVMCLVRNSWSANGVV